MNLVDIICLIFLVSWFILGAKKGLLHGILRVVVMIACLLLAYLFYPSVSNTLKSFVRESAWIDRAAFVGTFLFITVAVSTVAGRFLNTLGSSNRLGPINRMLGALLGGAQGLLYAAAGLILLSAMLGDGKLRSMIYGGKVASKITESITVSYGSMDKIIRKTGINPFVEPKSIIDRVEEEVAPLINEMEELIRER
ncbi:MAG: CvpA family protein [Deferribacteraceae bacterium]|jgi:uncharacterized membrane protein required for colicin V production|nr:CvpA family protein [Deferribacteraceae bacterium]